MLIALTEQETNNNNNNKSPKYTLLLNNYYDHGLCGAQADQQVLDTILKSKIPDLYQHFKSLDIDPSSMTLNWFMALFVDSVPFEVKK